MKSNAKLDQSGQFYRLNGQKCFITNGGESDLYLVMCRTGEKEISCLAVEKSMKGVSFGSNENKMGWNSSPTRSVFFEDVQVPIQNLVGQKG